MSGHYVPAPFQPGGTKKPAAAVDQGAPALPKAQLLTVKEAALLLRISHWALYRLMRDKQLHSVTIGRRRFVHVDDLHTYLVRLRREDSSL